MKNDITEMKRLKDLYHSGKISKEELRKQMLGIYEENGQHDKAQKLMGIETSKQDANVWKKLGY